MWLAGVWFYILYILGPNGYVTRRRKYVGTTQLFLVALASHFCSGDLSVFGRCWDSSSEAWISQTSIPPELPPVPPHSCVRVCTHVHVYMYARTHTLVALTASCMFPLLLTFRPWVGGEFPRAVLLCLLTAVTSNTVSNSFPSHKMMLFATS